MASSDTEDEDLKAAIAMSLASNESTGAPHASSASNPSEELPKPSGGLAGLDRGAMERERLARLAERKRQRPISPPAPRSPRPTRKLKTTAVQMPSGARLNMLSSLAQQDQNDRKSDFTTAANDQFRMEQVESSIASKMTDSVATKPSKPEPPRLAYAEGVVKKTWALGHERTGDDVKIEEVLEPLTLRTAVLSAYQWDVNWMLAKLKIPPNGGSTKCIFVMHAKDEALRKQMLKETESMRRFLRLCFPPMEGQIYCMHSKLMLLFHSHKLRIAIPTANLLNFDWGETGVMENSVFIIDLPRLSGGSKVGQEELTDFGKELMFFVDKQGLDDDVMSGMLNFDFSATSRLAFVHTIGGAPHGEEAARTGYPGLGRAVRQLGLQADDLEIDFAASSIGALRDDYLRAIHSAAKGEDVIAQASATASNGRADFFKGPVKRSPVASINIRDKMRIYFPTHETVRSSKAGAAGTIWLSRKWFEDMPFPRNVFRDYVSTRPGLLSHNKTLYARGKRKMNDAEATKDVAWAYVGSANMSESAWGKLVYAKKEKAWKINCRNWECGVLLPVPQEEIDRAETDRAGGKVASGNRAKTQLVGMEVFDELFSPPFVYPGATYDGREPWYVQEHLGE